MQQLNAGQGGLRSEEQRAQREDTLAAWPEGFLNMRAARYSSALAMRRGVNSFSGPSRMWDTYIMGQCHEECSWVEDWRGLVPMHHQSSSN